MNALPLRMRVLLYLYSTRNIVACATALVGPALLFMGVIQEGWLLITAALYGVGYFATPAPQIVDAQLTQTLSFDALIEQLDRVIEAARPHLYPTMIGRLTSIRRSIQEVRATSASSTRGVAPGASISTTSAYPGRFSLNRVASGAPEYQTRGSKESVPCQSPSAR